MKRTATANWKGTGKEGKGLVSTASTVLSNTQYSFNSRFAEGVGTNQEELIAAATPEEQMAALIEAMKQRE